MKNQVAGNVIRPLPLHSDGVLVQGIRGGSEAALEELIQKYAGKVYSLALRYTHNPQDAEEVLQDTFLKVFTRIETLRCEERPSPWLYKIAINAALVKLRERRRCHVSNTISLEDRAPVGGKDSFDASVPELSDRSPNAEEALACKELQEIVRIAIEKLPDHYRTAVQLKDIDGYSLEEAGEILEISVPALKTRLHRARLMILRMVTSCMEQREAKAFNKLERLPPMPKYWQLQ